MVRSFTRGLLAGTVYLLTIGCRRDAPARGDSAPAAAAPVGSDTVRGVIQIVGNDPVTTVLLVPRDTTRPPVALRGEVLPVLRQASGLEVMVRGQRTAARDVGASPAGVPVFAVTDFVVRAADGVTAEDGVLERRGTGYVLRQRDNTVRDIGTLPLALRDAVGARIYLVGSLSAPSSWGVLKAP